MTMLLDPKPQSFFDPFDYSKGHLHLNGCKGSAAALLAFGQFKARNKQRGGLIVIVAPSLEDAGRTADDLRAFAPEAAIGLLPTSESTPYDGARSDRAVSLQRAATLSALDNGRLDFLVTSASGWIRKSVPPALLQSATLHFRVGDKLSLQEVSQSLERGGYQRVPVVEDPGAFCIRGELLDVWPPGARAPLRLEMDFDELKSARSYDPDTQLTHRNQGGENKEELAKDSGIYISPAREAVTTKEGSLRARTSVRALCDAVSLPSSKARALIEDVASGQMFVGGDGYLPAHGKLIGLFERIGSDALVFFEDASRVVELACEELEQAQEALLGRSLVPHYPVAAHYLQGDELDRSVQKGVVCLQSMGVAGPPQSGFSDLSRAPLESASLNTEAHNELQAILKATRKSAGRNASLEPLAAQLKNWLEENYRIVLCARVSTQADRIASLLEHRGLEVKTATVDFSDLPPAGIYVMCAPLARGLIAPFERLVLLTEEEIFGQRHHRSPRKAAAAIKNALDDLRTLTHGDHIVHVEHGIGRYLGLQHRNIGSLGVELLEVEYAGGDKLLLPVYRLNQVQKYAGQGEPRLDKLGGQTFSRTKANVRKKVRIMADELLRLYAARKAVRREPLEKPGDEYDAFEAAFPYEETPDQAAAIVDVLNDLQKDTVMDRLVCGDVGFGKTEVALRATYLCAHAGRQVALLCPTTVLAEQHLRSFRERLDDTGIDVQGLSRFQSKKTQGETMSRLRSGSVDVVVGTHRLLSKDVHFKNLGLLIVDEEQRFGVGHKERLKELRKTVDVLTLSATPIPRTLSLAVGGMRDMSVIATAPQARRAIRTLTSRFDEKIIQEAIERELSRGGQVFYVFNRVEGIYERAEMIRRLVPSARVGVGHGQMSASSLEKTMLGFVNGEFDILCATTIIESGLDIPRANTIIIDRADLFGLSQLYQIRGRVGRSSERAFCYLLLPTEEGLSKEARSRIEALERYTELGSGFHVATMDMELRGAGELLGADQSGFTAKVGFELFADMLEEATAELSGETYISEVDPELSIDVEAFLPESYIEDIGVRLSLYKKYASAKDENEIAMINEEVQDRFGSPPEEAARFSEVMRLKTELRKIRALGLSATGRVATLHLRADTPLAAEHLVPFIAQSAGKYALHPDGKVIRRVKESCAEPNGLAHAERMLYELTSLARLSD